MARHRFVFAVLILIASPLIAAATTRITTAAATAARPLTAQATSAAAARAEETSIPSPRSVLGFSPGDDRTIADWRQITDYFSRLDAASERVLVQSIGETTLRRSLIVAFISAPENIRDLEKYKAVQRGLADPRLASADAERDRLVEQGKTVVAISCSIHSTEIVASQMSMQLAYELATAADEETREILRSTILILIPSANPDGIDIVADWYRRTLSTPYEGKEPPELYHHYAGHDDNRDWFMINLKETEAITTLFWKEWFPQIVYDVHQQGMTGSRFFIPPFHDPPNPLIAPLLLRQVGLLGYKVAADLQAANFRGVITNALYDTWWHGGFRTAPYYHNSIGILSEAASARLMTPVTVTRDQLFRATSRGMPSALQSATNFPEPWTGGLWRPRDIMAMEMVAARSILSMAAKYRASYLRNFYELGRANLSVSADAPLAYLIPAGRSRDEAVARMIGALTAQGVEVYRLERELHVEYSSNSLSTAPQRITLSGGYRKEGQPQSVEGALDGPAMVAEEIPAGSFIVFLAQPYGSNVRALFEPQVYPDRRAPGGEAEHPYDVAGWTLPMQMGVETQAVASIKEPISERRLKLISSQAEVHKDLGLPVEPNSVLKFPNPIRRSVRTGLYRSWTSSMDEGWTRFVFDTFGVPYRSVRDAEVRDGNLRDRYDVIILPSQRAKEIVEGREPGSYPAEFTGGITRGGVDNLRRFVEEGGTLVCFDASAELAIKYFTLPPGKGAGGRRAPFPLRNILEDIKTSVFYCPGSILSLDVVTTHPLAAGLARKVDAYFINSSAFEVTDAQSSSGSSVRVVARYAGQGVLRSGWLLGEGRIAGKIALAEVPFGSGRVIVFGFRPQHRGQTWGTFPFIFNSITTSAPPDEGG
ncbi:MAG TPA: M14 family metallopeptidase [Pyrinomonadaceae bacterium]|nr:M14 family metallopeptidase [Pyrinomonadaceae bacterium]